MSDWVNFQDWLELNRGSADAMADKVAGGVQQEGEAAQGKLNALTSQGLTASAGGSAANLQAMPGYGDAVGAGVRAGRDAKLLNTPGGQQAALQKSYGAGVNPWDVGAVQAAGGDKFAALQKQWGSFGDSLGLAQGKVNDYAHQRQGQLADLQHQRDASAAKQKAGADAAAQQQAHAHDEQALNIAKNSGYYGNDVAGARQWYRSQFGQDLP